MGFGGNEQKGERTQTWSPFGGVGGINGNGEKHNKKYTYNDRKHPYHGEGHRHTSPGRAESPKQEECKETHIKTQHN